MIKDRGNISLAQKAGGGVVAPEAVSFDGSTDYLSRATDLVGNVDSKTFTFSCWVYRSDNSATIYEKGTNNKFEIRISDDVGIDILARNSSNVAILFMAGIVVPRYTFSHLVVSVDLTNQAGSKVYLNDSEVSNTWTIFTNDTIRFTDTLTNHYVGGANVLQGRLSNLFLDYTYRDLSIEANRRIFSVPM